MGEKNYRIGMKAHREGAAVGEGEPSLSFLCEYTDKSIKPEAGCSDEKDT